MSRYVMTITGHRPGQVHPPPCRLPWFVCTGGGQIMDKRYALETDTHALVQILLRVLDSGETLGQIMIGSLVLLVVLMVVVLYLPGRRGP